MANENKKEDLERKVTDMDFIITQVNTKLGPIKETLEAEEESRDSLEQRKLQTLRQLQREIELAKVSHSQMQSDLDKLRAYEDSNNEANLASLEADRQRIAAQFAKVEEDIATLRDEKSELESKLNNQTSLKRNYNDNIRLRDYVKKETEASQLVENYAGQLDNMNFRKVIKSKEKLLRTHSELTSQKQRLQGQRAELLKTIEELETELRDEKLRDADEKYRLKSVEIEVKKVICDDLNKYYAAQDWAIMQFHRQKMEQINKIIRELWKTTYQGTDIDYIEIKTEDPDDPDNNTKAAAATKRGRDDFAADSEIVTGADKSKRKVDYSVVMVKGGVEMEMRGRCSAGQKVLASLIIRLALAETFSTDCGMIALDEPTTNLDQENIQALAEALVELVSKRSSQANFQLIVITHDNDLLDLLSKSDDVDRYWRLERTTDGDSIIKKIDLNNFR